MTTQVDPGLRVQAAAGVARLTLDRPESRNALSRDLLRALGEALDRIAGDESVRVVVLAAEGRVFSSGHDLREVAAASADELAALFEECSAVMLRIRNLPQPVIARVQGPAFAAGCQLVATCDLAVAADSATFAAPGVKIGLFCSTPMVPLARTVPPKAALEMLLTGEPIAADRALAIGLVNRVVPVDRLDEAVAALVDPIAASSPAVIRLGKAAFYQQIGRSEVEAYRRSCDLMSFNAAQPDAREGVAAFLRKRRAKWTQSRFEEPGERGASAPLGAERPETTGG